MAEQAKGAMEKLKEGVATVAEKAKEFIAPLTGQLKEEPQQKVEQQGIEQPKEKIQEKLQEGKEKVQKMVEIGVEHDEVILTAPSQGVIKEIYCKSGDNLRRSDKICLLENPTTRIIVCSDNSGKVKDTLCGIGDIVKQNQALFSMEVEIKHPGGLKEREKQKSNLEKKSKAVKKIDPIDIYKKQFYKAYLKEEKIRDDILRNKDWVDKNALYDGMKELFGEA